MLFVVGSGFLLIWSFFRSSPSSNSGPVERAEFVEVQGLSPSEKQKPTARIKILERALKVSKAQLVEKERELKQLKAQIEALKVQRPEQEEEPVTLRAPALVIQELKEIARVQGLEAYGTIKMDSPLVKELKAMGAEGLALLSQMLKEGSNTERFLAAGLMEKLEDPAAIPALEAALFDENEGNILLQRIASHALGQIGGEAAIPVLERAIDEGSEWGIRTNAAYSLAQMGRESGIKWFLDAYENEKESSTRDTLLQVMSSVADPSYLPLLHQSLQEETEYSKRILALMGISKAAQDSSLPVLEAIINNPDEDQMLISEAQKAHKLISEFGKD